MDDIHALGAGVSMATGGAKAIEGGNWQVFEGMLKHSKALLQLGTEVSCLSLDARRFSWTFCSRFVLGDRHSPSYLGDWGTPLPSPYEQLERRRRHAIRPDFLCVSVVLFAQGSRFSWSQLTPSPAYPVRPAVYARRRAYPEQSTKIRSPARDSAYYQPASSSTLFLRSFR